VVENGILKRVWGVQRDVTERKKMELALQESEKRYTDIFNRVQDALIIHDLAGKVVNVNDTMLQMYGVTREQAPTLSVLDDLSAPAKYDDSSEVWSQIMAGETLTFEWKARRPGDGSFFPAEVRLSKITLGNQDLILSNVRDITERKAAEKALREKTEELDRYFTSSLDLMCIAICRGTSAVESGMGKDLGLRSRRTDRSPVSRPGASRRSGGHAGRRFHAFSSDRNPQFHQPLPL
jgi:PAS domain S-box-containing protein